MYHSAVEEVHGKKTMPIQFAVEALESERPGAKESGELIVVKYVFSQYKNLELS